MDMYDLSVLDASRKFVEEMNRFPTDMIEALMAAHPEDWREDTLPGIGERVYVYNLPAECEECIGTGEVEDLDIEGIYSIRLDEGTRILATPDDFNILKDSSLPMWGWMWQFNDPTDEYWLIEKDGLLKMSQIGFRIYSHDDWGYFFGIDAAGFDFYKAYWIPLYEARGLNWHNI